MIGEERNGRGGGRRAGTEPAAAATAGASPPAGRHVGMNRRSVGVLLVLVFFFPQNCVGLRRSHTRVLTRHDMAHVLVRLRPVSRRKIKLLRCGAGHKRSAWAWPLGKPVKTPGELHAKSRVPNFRFQVANFSWVVSWIAHSTSTSTRFINSSCILIQKKKKRTVHASAGLSSLSTKSLARTGRSPRATLESDTVPYFLGTLVSILPICSFFSKKDCYCSSIDLH